MKPTSTPLALRANPGAATQGSTAAQRLKTALQYCNARIVESALATQPKTTETPPASTRKKRPYSDDVFWIFDRQQNKRRRYANDVSAALKQASQVEAQKHTQSYTRQTQAIKYAVTLWKILNAQNLVDDVQEAHDCSVLKCRQTRMEIAVWTARPSVQIHAHLHRCVRSLKHDDEDRQYCNFSEYYPKPYSSEPWENEHRIHVCVKLHTGDKAVSLCEYKHDRAMHYKQQTRLSVDHLYICNTSGALHFCNTEQCEFTNTHATEPSCSVSGLQQETKHVDKFYRPNGIQDSESTMLFKSMRRRIVSLDRWSENLIKKDTLGKIRAHINRLRPRVATTKPQLFYLAMAQALLRALDCDEVIAVRKRLQNRMVEYAADRAVNLVTIRHGKEHKGMVSLSDLGNEIFAVQRRVHIPPMITNDDARLRYYKTISDTIVKLWYLVRLYAPKNKRPTRGASGSSASGGPKKLTAPNRNTAIVVANRNTAIAPHYPNVSHSLGEFDMFIFPALAAIREGIYVQYGSTICAIVPCDRVTRILIPPPEELERLYPKSAEFRHKQRFLRKILQEAISFVNKDPDSLCLANFVAEELDGASFPMSFTTGPHFDHIETMVNNDARGT